MKKIFLLSLIAFFSLASNAQTYTTKSGYVGCVSKSAFDKYMKYAVDKDYAAADALVKKQLCFSLKSGVTVYVEDTSWGKVEIRPKGLTGTIWTVMEAIRRN
tara:strand:+ start:135 stop:440 length:306 start_codon:yes stop_codon:yes gene_type:complete